MKHLNTVLVAATTMLWSHSPFDRASCRRYGHRSLQEFSQPDRRKGFRTIASLSVNNALRRLPDDTMKIVARKDARAASLPVFCFECFCRAS